MKYWLSMFQCDHNNKFIRCTLSITEFNIYSYELTYSLYFKWNLCYCTLVFCKTNTSNNCFRILERYALLVQVKCFIVPESGPSGAHFGLTAAEGDEWKDITVDGALRTAGRSRYGRMEVRSTLWTPGTRADYFQINVARFIRMKTLAFLIL